MASVIIQNKTFEKVDFKSQALIRAEYEQCLFKNCDLSEADLTDIKFYDCHFTGCNLSIVKFSKTVLREVKFEGCKMLGLLFENCNEFGFTVSFKDCNLTHSSFYRKKIKKTVFISSVLKEVDFTDCDLSGSMFKDCDLSFAKFENTNLEKSDLSSSYNFSIDPAMNRINRARFSLSGLPGLLEKYDLNVE